MHRKKHTSLLVLAGAYGMALKTNQWLAFANLAQANHCQGQTKSAYHCVFDDNLNHKYTIFFSFSVVQLFF